MTHRVIGVELVYYSVPVTSWVVDPVEAVLERVDDNPLAAH